jgi:hypothetical protein
MHASELPLGDQIFTHFEDAGPGLSVQRTFAASALRRYCQTPDSVRAGVARQARIALDGSMLAMLLTRRGLEDARLLRALATPRYAPLLFCLMPDGSALLVDGSHTYAAMLMRGFKLARGYLVPECIWRNFLVTGLRATTAEELLATPSWAGVELAETEGPNDAGA